MTACLQVDFERISASRRRNRTCSSCRKNERGRMKYRETKIETGCRKGGTCIQLLKPFSLMFVRRRVLASETWHTAAHANIQKPRRLEVPFRVSLRCFSHLLPIARNYDRSDIWTTCAADPASSSCFLLSLLLLLMLYRTASEPWLVRGRGHGEGLQGSRAGSSLVHAEDSVHEGGRKTTHNT